MKKIITLGLALAATTSSLTSAGAAGIVPATERGTTCPTPISVEKRLSEGETWVGGFGDWTWSAGVSSGVKLFGDCNAIGIEASAELRGRVLGTLVKPAEMRLEAKTDKDDHQSLVLRFLALGFEIESYDIANSDQTLKARILTSHVLPEELEGTIGPYEFGIDGQFDLSFEMGYEVVGQYLGILNYDIGPHKLDAKVYAYVDAGASVYASSAFALPIVSDLSLQGEAVIDLIRGSADAQGSFTETYKAPENTLAASAVGLAQPSINNAWLVKASAGYYIYEGLEGRLTVHVAVPLWWDFDTDLLELPGLPASFQLSDGWSYEKTYFKTF